VTAEGQESSDFRQKVELILWVAKSQIVVVVFVVFAIVVVVVVGGGGGGVSSFCFLFVVLLLSSYFPSHSFSCLVFVVLGNLNF